MAPRKGKSTGRESSTGRFVKKTFSTGGIGKKVSSTKVVSAKRAGSALPVKAMAGKNLRRPKDTQAESVAPDRPSVSFVREVAKVGNSAMVRIHRAELEELKIAPGAAVRVTLEVANNEYMSTTESAERMLMRYSTTMALLA